MEAAFWWLQDDTWKLVLATPLAQTEGPLAVYRKLREALRQAGIPREIFERTSVLSPSTGVVTVIDLGSTGRVPMNRFVLQELVGGAYVEGAYFYRFAPKTFDRAS